MRDQSTVPTTHILTTGDIVQLKEPYKPADFPQARNSDWPGFAYGIVVEIVNTQTIINGEAYGDRHPKNVSLHLYDATGRMMIEPTFVEAELCILTYVDFYVSELELYKIAISSGYLPVASPPDWERIWQQEKAMLSEFIGLD